MGKTEIDIPPKYKRFFEDLDENNILYCHWKSNEHLIEGLLGDTDLDILIKRNKKDVFESILKSYGFKRFDPRGYNNYSGVENYIGYDPITDKDMHLHIHYDLVLGRRLKQYRVPWENTILKNRQRHEDTGIFINDHNLELLLLYIRQSLKLRKKNVLKSKLGREIVSDDIKQEYKWLTDRSEPS